MHFFTQKVSEYDQEISQSHTADQPNRTGDFVCLFCCFTSQSTAMVMGGGGGGGGGRVSSPNRSD